MGTVDAQRKVKDLIAQLGSKDGLQREQARKALVKIGRPVVGPLLGLLTERKPRLRWEACKTLGAIGDPSTAGPLVAALQDESIEVQWLAAEALVALGRKAVVPLLQSLEMHFDSVVLRQGAHHVLHALERERLLNRQTQQVLESLRSLSTEIPVAVAARRALVEFSRTGRWKEKGKKK